METPVESKVHCPYCSSDDIFSKGSTCICGECGKKFKLPDEENHFKPMELFLSYGHPEAEICKQIKQALENRGHKVWFDEEQIIHGSDWRERIAQGIRNSNGVIACLSRHSVRDPGVCLDELSIAIGVRGGNIKTVLLDPEQDTNPPASVCHIQWLDMSSWRTYFEKGEAVFRPWFEQKMSQLFEIIESDESQGFAGQISAIRDKLYINYDTGKQNDLLKSLFVGREWLTEQLEQWLDDPDGARLCLLYGDPGVGKSAFAAHYIHYNPRVAAGLFCEYDRPHYNDARTVIMTLAYLLACRLPSYRVALADILEREKRLGELEASELFDCLLATPLSDLAVDGGHETLCIVIDGLDECSQGEQNALAETLARYVPRLPKWLRVLATAREVSAVKGPLQGAYHLKLHGTQKQNREDIRLYFEKRLHEKWGKEPGWQAALAELAQRSGGIFLYARLVTEGILSGKISIDDPSGFPDGLSASFYQWFGWFFPDDREYMDHFRLPLGMLLAAPEPLPTDELKRIFAWDDNDLEDFLRRIEVLLRRDVNVFHKETVIFSHLYIAQWLDSHPAGRFRSRRSAALERMAKHFYALFQQDAEKLTEFEALHLSKLLEQSGEDSARDEAMMSRNLLGRIIHFGDFCNTWGALPEAMQYFRQAQTMAEHITDHRKTPEDFRNLSIIYHSVTGILQDQGDLDGAMAVNKKALAICEQLTQEQCTPEDYQVLSGNYVKAADLLRDQGNPDSAIAFYQKALAIDDQLVQARGTPEDLRNLGISYHKVAGILRDQGNPDDAITLYQASLAIWEQLVQERGTPEDRRNLSISYECIAELLRDQGNPNDAMALYRTALAIQEQLVQERGTPEDRSDLSISYECVADLLRDQGNPDSAMVLYQKTLAMQEQLVQERGTPKDRRHLSIIYHKAAGILRDQGNPNGAIALYQKALVLREQLVQERGTPEDSWDLSFSYDSVAEILQNQGNPDGAMALYQKALAIQEQLVQERGTPKDRRGLSLSCHKIAGILIDQGNPDRAIAFYRKALATDEQLVQEQGTPNDLWSLSANYHHAAELLQDQGDSDGALTFSRKALATLEQLVQERGTPNDRRGLNISYHIVADLLQDRGDPDSALVLLQKALVIDEQLVQERGTPEDLMYLSSGYNSVADILQSQGDSDGAKTLREKALAIQKQ